MESMIEQLLNESESMLKHALSQGLTFSPNIADRLYALQLKHNAVAGSDSQLAPEDVRSLSAIHQELVGVVAPATPRTLRLLSQESEQKGFFHFLGPVPLIRQLSLVSLALLLLLMLLAASPIVDIENINAGFFYSDGLMLFLNESFLLCCAGLGAAFAGLFRANTYIANSTYDPKYNSSYWSTLILGFMAGVIMVELLPVEMFTAEDSALRNFGKPAFALLGGFSASFLYRLLNRLIDTADHLVRGDRSEIDNAQAAAANAKLAEKRTLIQTGHAAKLLKLENALNGCQDIEQVKKLLDDMINETLPVTAAGQNSQAG